MLQGSAIRDDGTSAYFEPRLAQAVDQVPDEFRVEPHL
jgi:hypothetical protein